MAISSELVNQFVKITNDKEAKKSDTTAYGTVMTYKGQKYVKIDGSEQLTPAASTAEAKDGERVIVMIKNRTAIVTGNVSSPSARLADIQDVGDLATEITRLDILIADKVTSNELYAANARIDTLVTENLTIRGQLTVNNQKVEEVSAKYATITGQLIANDASIEELYATKIDVDIADAKYATIADLEATEAYVYNFEATYGDFVDLTTGKLAAIEADLLNLNVGNLDAKYANIDFSNIGDAAMEYFYSTSGLIENVTVADGTVTGRLVGVTLSGDIIEGNTVVADKLVIKGEDGLYYKLNTDGMTTQAEQTEYNSLNGTIIMAKSVTAEKVDVSDLVAFDATIGGFTITENAIYSEVKDSEDNTTRGIYMDTDGQLNFGDSSNFVKYYRDEDGTYKLSISAASILYSLEGKQYSIADLGRIGDYVHIGTYEGEPCIELGETDSNFRLIITNTRIMFMEDSDVPAYINNRSLHIKKAVIEEELQQGEFVWKIRDNGNMGLVWKGGS